MKCSRASVAYCFTALAAAITFGFGNGRGTFAQQLESEMPIDTPDIEWVTSCHQQGWWTLLLAPRDNVIDQLPTGFDLPDNVSALNWPEGYHPILLETQIQSNCSEKDIPFITTSFHEFKFEIPFVIRRSESGGEDVIDDERLFMVKPLLYANTWTDVIGASTEYGLNIFHAKNMPVNDSYFAVEYNNGLFEAAFDPAGSQWVPAAKALMTDHLDVFINMTTTPWLCKSATKCAYNRYDWSTARVRPMSSMVSFGKGVLPDMGIDTIHVAGTNVTAYGTIQLDAILHISAVTDCPY